MISKICFIAGVTRSLVDAARIVVGEMKTVRGPQVGPILAESVRQARQAPHLHSDGKVLPLDISRGSHRGVGASDYGLLPTSNAHRWAVALLGFWPPCVLFDQRRVVNTVTQGRIDGVQIGRAPIRGQLERLRRSSMTQSFYKSICSGLVPRPNAKFRISLVCRSMAAKQYASATLSS